MSHEVVHLSARSESGTIRLRPRLERMASIFQSIEAGELLAALPDCPIARANHTAALNLLGIVESELHVLCLELAEIENVGPFEIHRD